MALYPCPECQTNISEKAKTCPKCGAAWAGICPECHLFRDANAVTCIGCGHPFSVTTKLRDKIKGIDATEIGLGKLWMNFWTYVSLPVGATFCAMLGFFAVAGFLASPREYANGEEWIPLSSVFLIVVAVYQISVAVGLTRRKMWAFTNNLFLIFVTSLSFFVPWITVVGESNYFVSPGEKTVTFVVGLVFAIAWWIPNQKYWRKRQKWFEE